MKALAKADYIEKMELKNRIEKVAPAVREKIRKHYEANKEKFENDMKTFKEDLTAEFKKKVVSRARELYE